MLSPSRIKGLSEIELRDLEDQIENERLRRSCDKSAMVESSLTLSKGGQTFVMKLFSMPRGRLDELRDMFGGEGTILTFTEEK